MDAAGAGGSNGAESRERERVSGQWENPAGKSSGIRDGEGGPKASGVAENPEVDCQGVGGGVELPRGTVTLEWESYHGGMKLLE